MSENPLFRNLNADRKLGIPASGSYSLPYSDRNEVNSQALLSDIVAYWHRLSPQIQQALHLMVSETLERC